MERFLRRSGRRRAMPMRPGFPILQPNGWANARWGLLCLAAALAWPLRAETVDLETASQALSAASAAAASIDADATEAWSRTEQEQIRLRDEATAAQLDLARSPAPGAGPDAWLRNGELDRDQQQRWAREAGEMARDRQTLNWWLDQQSRGAASAAPAPALPAASEVGGSPRRRALGVVALFAAAVLLGLMLLLRHRPHRRHRRRHGRSRRNALVLPRLTRKPLPAVQATPFVPGLEGRRPRRRRRRHTGGTPILGHDAGR